jgi:hypothetical protein
MVQRGKELRLAADARATLVVQGKQARDDLHRHVAIQLRIVGAVDLAHAAAADQRANFVLTNRPQGERVGAIVLGKQRGHLMPQR